jgi:hypothetical protein
MSENTPINIKTEILSDIWLNYRNDTEFEDFIQYNDLGLPLAYAINAGIVAITDRATEFVNETFALLLAGLDIEEDTGFESLDDILQLGDE